MSTQTHRPHIADDLANELFGGLTESTAPAPARPLLAKARELFGFVPNLAVAMAAVPSALEGYFHVLQAFGDTPLSPIEQQIVLMSVSRANRADYSLAVHAALALKLGADPSVVRAVGTGASIVDAKLSALRRFTEALTVGRGQVPAHEVDAFVAAGYDRAAIVAVAFGVAIKTFANALAHLARTPVDAAFAPALASLHS
jgi:AhpD family alkylhydroperoxidase